MSRRQKHPTLNPTADLAHAHATFSPGDQDFRAVLAASKNGNRGVLHRFKDYFTMKLHLAPSHDSPAKSQSPQPRSATPVISSKGLSRRNPPPVSLAAAIVSRQLALAPLGDNQVASFGRKALLNGGAVEVNRGRDDGAAHWSTLKSTLEVIERAAKNRSDYAELATNLNSITESLVVHLQSAKSTRMSNCIDNFAHGILQEIKEISQQQSQSTLRHYVEVHSSEEDLIKRYRRIDALFKRLEMDARLSFWSLYDEDSANKRLDRLGPAKQARHNSALSTQLDRLHAAKVRWMTGMPGTGKTTIAYSFAEGLEARRELGASFFCVRGSPECQEANQIIPTIAYQLARYSTPFQRELCQILGQNPDLSSEKISTQFTRLLKDPLLTVKDAIPDKLVVIIDALDECADKRGATEIMDLLLQHAVELPLKFFITSRPDADIHHKISHHKDLESHCSITDLRSVGQSMIQQDIEIYLRDKLRLLSPTHDQIQLLVQRSGRLFLYAATIVRYIQPNRPTAPHKERLDSILTMTSTSTNKVVERIDSLYAAVVKSVFDEANPDAYEAERLKGVLWTVLCAQDSVDVETIRVLAGLEEKQQVIHALDSLASVISLSKDEHVSTVHTSFIEFMLDPKRSKSLCCDKKQHNQWLTRQCFKLMEKYLRFNICGLESPHQPDEGNPLVARHVDERIPPALLYACRYWADHLQASDMPHAFSTAIDDFLSKRLLFWMEVLNLKRMINEGEDVLFKAMAWLKARNSSSEVIRFAEDSRNFVTGFAANKLSICTPHIYISALPFCHRLSSVFQHYSGRVPRLLKVQGSLMDWRKAAPLASSSWGKENISSPFAFSSDGSLLASGISGEEHMISVRNIRGVGISRTFPGPPVQIVALALSPDAKHVACASNDFKVQVWDVRNGTSITSPLEGHTAAINSLSFSSDGSRIASGSGDRTIRIYHLSENEPIILRKTGVVAPIRSIAFSPDGSFIVSGCDNSEILLWDIGKQALITSGSQFKGHTSSVNSVAFSPDGKYILSGSSDCTIRIWSSPDGQPRFKLIDRFDPNDHGHADPISSVAFSPDGLRIVSASLDSTIRIWETQSGQLITGPFEGPCQIVAATFSTDGTRVISASCDSTIQTWNAHSGVLVDSTTKDDKYAITSVAIAPNGQRIASGCSDGIIRLWNAKDGAVNQPPLQGHDGAVRTIAWSPDNTLVATGSDDSSIRVWVLPAETGDPVVRTLKGHNGTIRVWDAFTGELVINPLEGSTDSVVVAIFSSDGASIVSGSGDSLIRVHRAENGTKTLEESFGKQSTKETSLAARVVQSRVADPVVAPVLSSDGAPVSSGSKYPTAQTQGVENSANVHEDSSTKEPSLTSRRIRNEAADLFRANLTRNTRAIKKANRLIRTLEFTALAFSPDTQQVAFGRGDRSIHIWDIHKHSPSTNPLTGHTSPVSSLAFSPDSARLVSASPDGTVRVWDVRTGVAIAGPFQHANTGAILSVCFSPDGASVISGCENSTIFMWDVRAGEDGTASSAQDDWNIEEDGWVLTPKSERLFWVPHDIACYKPTQRTKLVIGPHGAICIDHQDLLKGYDWRQFDSCE
ncbi:hypothetical protein RSAG8_13185, partial [Rhizoctonia solani AG-8 WAC10335]